MSSGHCRAMGNAPASTSLLSIIHSMMGEGLGLLNLPRNSSKLVGPKRVSPISGPSYVNPNTYSQPAYLTLAVDKK